MQNISTVRVLWWPCIALCLLLISGLANAAVYRWVDENGKVHFSDKPRKNAEQMTIRKPNSTNLGGTIEQRRRQQEMLRSFEEERREKKALQEKQKQRQARLDAHCRRLSNRLKNYQEADRVFLRDETGAKKMLDGASKRREMDALARQIEDQCS